MISAKKKPCRLCGAMRKAAGKVINRVRAHISRKKNRHGK